VRYITRSNDNQEELRRKRKKVNTKRKGTLKVAIILDLHVDIFKNVDNDLRGRYFFTI
jgi:hypothetical protein